MKTLPGFLLLSALSSASSVLSSPSVVPVPVSMAEPLTISIPPVIGQNFIVSTNSTRFNNANNLDGSYYLFRNQAVGWYKELKLPGRVFTTSLNIPKRVRIFNTAQSNVYPCIVFSKNINPRIGDSGNIHWFPTMQVSLGVNQTTTETGSGHVPVTYSSSPDTLELPSDYRYFVVYWYDLISAQGDTSFAVWFPPWDVANAGVGSVQGSGNGNWGLITLTFYGE